MESKSSYLAEILQVPEYFWSYNYITDIESNVCMYSSK